jgi:hypothetical protein
MHAFYKGRSNKPIMLPNGNVIILRPMTYYKLPDGTQVRGVANLVRVGNPKGRFVDLSDQTGTVQRRTASALPVKPKKLERGLAYTTAVTVKKVGTPGGIKDDAPSPIVIDEKKPDVADAKAERAAAKRAEQASDPEPDPEPEPEMEPEMEPEHSDGPDDGSDEGDKQESPEQEQKKPKKATKKRAPKKT